MSDDASVKVRLQATDGATPEDIVESMMQVGYGQARDSHAMLFGHPEPKEGPTLEPGERAHRVAWGHKVRVERVYEHGQVVPPERWRVEVIGWWTWIVLKPPLDTEAPLA